jgi:ABC-2 type transport system ATP-binding protein
MSLQIKNLTKIYGVQKAVDNISFSVAEGEIVGFLGPNGAGKSTTMKIATGYLPPTDGVVVVGDHNVVAEPLKVKKIVGYLPEHNPLYLDMFVHEYLRFVGGLYGLKGKVLVGRIAEMVDQCGLQREQNKKIEALSKGYRQRVGLAQALIHDPKVLILDEPTSGLDPNQLLEIRKLIKDISHNKTVIFSTHIMQEVKALCDRVILINKGSIVADDTLDNLMNRKDQPTPVLAEFEHTIDIDLLKNMEAVSTVGHVSGFTYRILPKTGKDIRSEIFRLAADKNLSLVGLKVEENSLESIFQELTTTDPVS